MKIKWVILGLLAACLVLVSCYKVLLRQHCVTMELVMGCQTPSLGDSQSGAVEAGLHDSGIVKDEIFKIMSDGSREDMVEFLVQNYSSGIGRDDIVNTVAGIVIKLEDLPLPRIVYSVSADSVVVADTVADGVCAYIIERTAKIRKALRMKATGMVSSGMAVLMKRRRRDADCLGELRRLHNEYVSTLLANENGSCTITAVIKDGQRCEMENIASVTCWIRGHESAKWASDMVGRLKDEAFQLDLENAYHELFPGHVALTGIMPMCQYVTIDDGSKCGIYVFGENLKDSIRVLVAVQFAVLKSIMYDGESVPKVYWDMVEVEQTVKSAL